MGCIASNEARGASGSAAADPPEQKKAKKKEPDLTVELVLLGQGESGKSTIFKQMRIIQAQEEGRAQAFQEDERKGARLLVYDNMVAQMKLLVKVALDEEMEFDSKAHADLARELLEKNTDNADMSAPEVGATLKSLWSDSALKLIYGERDRLFNLNDSAGYFWDEIDRIYAPGYVPSEADILRLRVRTRGLDEAIFTYKDTPFRVTDLGGQRSERREWQAALQKASSILFVCSLCEWDQKLREDFNQSRMMETQHIFKSLVEDPVTANKGITILLNKLDLFREKLKDARKQEGFKNYFTDFKGTLTADSGVAHIKDYFLKLARNTKRRAYAHAIIAVETDNVKIAWRDVRSQAVHEVVQGLL